MESTHLLAVPPSGEQVCHHAFRRITIEPVMLLYFMYYSGSSTLVSQFVHNQMERKDNGLSYLTPCSVNNVQSEASLWLMYMNIAATVTVLSVVVSTFCVLFIKYGIDSQAKAFKPI